jgi:hypothetical protein
MLSKRNFCGKFAKASGKQPAKENENGLFEEVVDGVKEKI